MPMYEWKCKKCGCRVTSSFYVEDGMHPCPACSEPMVRVYSFSVARPMQEHFNTTVDKPISSMSQFKEALRIKSAEESERLNLNVNLQPVDLMDRETLGVTEEGLDATFNRHVAEGKDTSWVKTL